MFISLIDKAFQMEEMQKGILNTYIKMFLIDLNCFKMFGNNNMEQVIFQDKKKLINLAINSQLEIHPL